MKTSFLRKPKRALCIILVLCSAAFYIIYVWGKDNSENSRTVNESFAITQRYYGIDAAEMERIAAIPLEDALSGIRGLRRIYSSSENGRARVFCHFEGKEQGRYEAVREAAQRVYESLPSAAQRPEISSSGDSRVPVWTAAISADKTKPENIGVMLEKTVKPALEGLPGAANVEISGAGAKEIVITLKSEEAAARKITASDIANVLAQNDVLLPGGTVRYGRANGFASLEIPVMVDGRYKSGNVLDELRGALIPVKNSGGGANLVRLEDLAFIAEQEKDYESRSRLDGKETALIAVRGSEDADLGKLSARIKDEFQKFPELEFTVLSDRGKTEREARSSALGAAFQGACMVAFLCAILSFGKRRFSLICSLTVPAAFFFSAALLILLGFSLDKLVLAGLSAGVGAAVDTAILSAEYFRSCRTIKEGRSALQALRFPLVSGALTTVIALLPLLMQKTSGMNSVAWAVASVNMVSMILALTLLPPLFLWNKEEAVEAADLKCDRFSAQKAGADLKCDRFSAQKAVADLKCEHFKSKKALDLKCNRFKAIFTSSIFPPMLRFYRRRLALLIRLILRRPLPVICCWLLLSVLGITALFLNGADVEQESSEDSVYAQIEFEGGLHMEETDKLLAL
jgi:multidrug efflux pump subunit AcrB